MTDQHAIYNEVSALLVKLFEIDPQEIKPEARLYDDLELDSIDAVDMIVHLQKKTGKKIKPEEFKAVRTVQDVVDAVERLLIRRVGRSRVACADRRAAACLAFPDLVWPGAPQPAVVTAADGTIAVLTLSPDPATGGSVARRHPGGGRSGYHPVRRQLPA